MRAQAVDELIGGDHAAMLAEHAAHRHELAVFRTACVRARFAVREGWHGDKAGMHA